MSDKIFSATNEIILPIPRDCYRALFFCSSVFHFTIGGTTKLAGYSNNVSVTLIAARNAKKIVLQPCPLDF